jgi:type IV pilus assembly protein PilW
MKHLNKQNGLSLVEIMVSMTLGLLVIAAVIYLFLSSKQTYAHTDRMVRMNENGRYALSILSDDMRLIDFWGEARTLDIQTDSSLDAIADDCTGVGIGYDFRIPFGAGTTNSSSILDCIDDAIPNSDFIVIKHAATTPTAEGSVAKDQTYMVSNIAVAI